MVTSHPPPDDSRLTLDPLHKLRDTFILQYVAKILSSTRARAFNPISNSHRTSNTECSSDLHSKETTKSVILTRKRNITRYNRCEQKPNAQREYPGQNMWIPRASLRHSDAILGALYIDLLIGLFHDDRLERNALSQLLVARSIFTRWPS